jgi:hypothetical protein
MTFSAWYSVRPFRFFYDAQCLILNYVPSGLFMMFTCLILRMSLPGRLWCSVPDTKNVPFGLSMMFMPDTKNLPSRLSMMFTCLILRIIFRVVYGAHIPDTQNVSSGLSMVFTFLILRISSYSKFYMTITYLTLRMSLTVFLFSLPWYSESPSFLGLHGFHVLCTQHLLLFQILHGVHFKIVSCSRLCKY